MSRDAGNYLILVEKILCKAKEVSWGLLALEQSLVGDLGLGQSIIRAQDVPQSDGVSRLLHPTSF